MSQRTSEERACVGCGRPLPHQEQRHGRPTQYCSSCRNRRKKLSSTRSQRGHEKVNEAFVKEQIDQAKQAFADLPTVAKAMLRYWISHAIAPAASLEPRDAARLKKDFSSEVGLVSLHQFVGAMLDAGYEPMVTNDGRWLFAIQRANDVSSPDEPAWRYTLGRPTPHFNQLDRQLQEHIDLFGPLTSEDASEDEEELEDVDEV